MCDWETYLESGGLLVLPWLPLASLDQALCALGRSFLRGAWWIDYGRTLSSWEQLFCARLLIMFVDGRMTSCICFHYHLPPGGGFVGPRHRTSALLLVTGATDVYQKLLTVVEGLPWR